MIDMISIERVIVQKLQCRSVKINEEGQALDVGKETTSTKLMCMILR